MLQGDLNTKKIFKCLHRELLNRVGLNTLSSERQYRIL